MEKDAILMVAISYDGRDSRPHRKFKVENVSRVGRQHFGPRVFGMLSGEADRHQYEATLHTASPSFSIDNDFGEAALVHAFPGVRRHWLKDEYLLWQIGRVRSMLLRRLDS